MAFEEDEVGAIDTGDESAGLDTSRRVPAQEDNSGMGPVGAIDTSDNSGMGPVDAGAQGAPQTDRTGPNGPIMRQLKAFPGNAKRIIGYLMGEGAADPMQLQQAAAAVDPEGRMSADDRNVVAIQKVAQEQGPEAAWKLAQANRVAFNAKQAFGFAALNGTAQKMPDVNAAIDAANQAASHVLDGSSVKFAPGQGGVTATVMTAGAEPQTFRLSLEQFRNYMNVGGAGQYDRLTQESIPATLAMLAQGGGAQPQRRGPPPPKAAPSEADNYKPPAIPSNFGKTPSTQNLSGDDNVSVQPPTDAEKTGYSEQLQARANSMMPGITREEERQRFMAGEAAREDTLQNKIDVEETKGKYGTAKEEVKGGAARDVAETKAGAWKYASDHKLQAAQVAAAAKAAADGDKNARAAIENARKSIAAKRATLQPLTPDEEAMEKRLASMGLGAQPGQQQAPQQAPAAAPQQAPQQQAPGQPPEPGAKFYKGSWYRRGPNGEAQRIQ
jgi:hypothetical protein